MIKQLALSAALALALVVAAIAPRAAHAQPEPRPANWAKPYNLENPPVRPGIEVLLSDPQYLALVRGKRVGLLTNPSGVDSNLVSTVDLLHRHPDITLAALFAPEHGIRGDVYAGARVEQQVDPGTGVTVYSLYGATRRPRPEWLEGIDVMLYDIQDVGASSYTYIYSMAHLMEECAKHDIPFVVLDRPNPLGADFVDGMVLDTTQYKTFVGYYDIAYCYGMTPGEIATLFNNEFHEDKADLTVVPMSGYDRRMRQWDTGLPFVPTSNYVPTDRHPYYLHLTGILGENRRDISIGIGYPLPFQVIAAPWIDRDEFVQAIRDRQIPGLKVRPITFTPLTHSFKDEVVYGAHFIISDFTTFRPVTASVHIMEILQSLYPEAELFSDEKMRRTLFDKVAGGDELRAGILAGKSADEIIAEWQPRLAEFMAIREKHLIYR